MVGRFLARLVRIGKYSLAQSALAEEALILLLAHVQPTFITPPEPATLVVRSCYEDTQFMHELVLQSRALMAVCSWPLPVGVVCPIIVLSAKLCNAFLSQCHGVFSFQINLKSSLSLHVYWQGFASELRNTADRGSD